MIMTRKNLILLLFSLLTLNSCNKHEGPELRFCENYIQNYCQGIWYCCPEVRTAPANPGRPANPHTQFWIELTDCEWISPKATLRSSNAWRFATGTSVITAGSSFGSTPLLLPIIFRQCILPAMPTGMKSIRRGHCWTISCGPNFGPTPIISVADTKQGRQQCTDARRGFESRRYADDT